MLVQPYLFFDGRCEEALEFYKKALGAEVLRVMRFRDNPDAGGGEGGGCAGPTPPPDKIMHASFRIGETELMASDGSASGKPAFQGISLSLSLPDAARAERAFAALADGGQVQMPLAKTFFASAFGMVADRFGVSWMIIAQP